MIEIAQGVLVLAGCVVLVAAIPLAVAVRRQWAEVRLAAGRAEREFLPLLRDLMGVARDLTSVTATIRGDVEMVHATVADVNSRVKEVVRVAEHRVAELDALLGVAQQEAESVLLSASAAARGVRAGAAALANIVGVGTGYRTGYRDDARSEATPRAARGRTRSGNGPRSGGPGGGATVTHDSGDLGDADEQWGEGGDEREAPRVGPRRRGR